LDVYNNFDELQAANGETVFVCRHCKTSLGKSAVYNHAQPKKCQFAGLSSSATGGALSAGGEDPVLVGLGLGKGAKGTGMVVVEGGEAVVGWGRLGSLGGDGICGGGGGGKGSCGG